MAPQPSASRRGHLWNTYKYFYQHRHVEDGAREGVVTRRLYSTRQLPSQVPSDQDKFEVLWWDEAEGKYDHSRPDQLLYPALKGIVTDQFVDRLSPFTPPIIQHVILPLQEANWVVTDEEHVAMLEKAKQASRELRAQGKLEEKELDQLIAVTDEEQGLQANAPRPEKPAAKKPNTAGKDKDKQAAADKGTTAAGAGPSSKAAAAAGQKRKEGAAKQTGTSKAQKSASAAAAAGGPSSSKQAAATARVEGDSGLGGSCAEAEDSKSFDTSHEDDLSSDFEGQPSNKVQPAAAAAAGGGKKRKQQKKKPEGHQEAAKKQMTAGAAATKRAVKGVTGRVYPSAVVYVAGDRRLGSAEYAEGNEDAEYPVESIVDEVEIVGGTGKGKKTKKQVKVLPKWQGYELDPHGWQDKAGLKQVEAYVKWAAAAKKPAYFTAVSNDSAAKAYVQWDLDRFK